MYHHDKRDYAVAASEAATFARSKYEGMIERGRKASMALLERIHTEVPRDRIVAGKAMRFDADEHGLIIDVGDGPQALHANARAQLAERAGVPNDFLTRNAESEDRWRKDMAIEVLSRSYGNIGGRYLSRSVSDEVRGVLSSRYRRIDVRPCLDMFVEEAINGFGAVPLDGVGSDVKVSMRVALPMIFEPVPNEVMLYGLQLDNSDFGKGAVKISTFVDRIWCTNLATMREDFGAVHLGGELPEDVEFSARTMELDTERTMSAMRDVIRNALEPGKVNGMMKMIEAANEKDVDWKSARSKLQKALLKSELAAVEESFEKDESVLLPPAKSVWRLSNTLSLLAQKAETPDRRMELERLAGGVLEGKLPTAA